jgi:hypothetical protein
MRKKHNETPAFVHGNHCSQWHYLLELPVGGGSASARQERCSKKVSCEACEVLMHLSRDWQGLEKTPFLRVQVYATYEYRARSQSRVTRGTMQCAHIRGATTSSPLFKNLGTPLRCYVRRTVTQLCGLLSSERSNQIIHVLRLHMHPPRRPPSALCHAVEPKSSHF